MALKVRNRTTSGGASNVIAAGDDGETPARRYQEAALRPFQKGQLLLMNVFLG